MLPIQADKKEKKYSKEGMDDDWYPCICKNGV